MLMQAKPVSPRKVILLIFNLGLFALALAACGDSTPTGKTEQLLVNEVYTGEAAGGTQWIEFLNNTDAPLNLNGYVLETRYGRLDLGAAAGQRSTVVTGSLIVFSNSPQAVADATCKILNDSNRANPAIGVDRPCPPAPVQETTIIGRMNPDADILVLKNAQGVIVDQIGWGTTDAALKAQLGVTTDVNMGLRSPKGAQVSLGRTSYLGQRINTIFQPDPAPPGRIDPGEFTIHNTPLALVNLKPPSPASFHPFLRTVTDFIATIGAIVLWLVFVFIALVARRFQTLADQKTYWQYLMVAPIGIFIYAVIQVWNFVSFGRLIDFWSWPAFGALFLSGVACLYVINIFRLIAKNILEAE
jgi:Lamin Tail Domain